MDIAKLVLEYLRVLIWPSITLSICLVFRNQIAILFNRIQKAQIPGGISFDLAENLEEAKSLAAKIQKAPSSAPSRERPMLTPKEVNSRILELNLKPSPSGLDMSFYRELSDQDPTLALALLRVEMDFFAKNFAKGSKLELRPMDIGFRLWNRLFENGTITIEQLELAQAIRNVCNAAVHGEPVTEEQAELVIESAEVLAGQYIAWIDTLEE